jgi:hypothetical protein
MVAIARKLRDLPKQGVKQGEVQGATTHLSNREKHTSPLKRPQNASKERSTRADFPNAPISFPDRVPTSKK